MVYMKPEAIVGIADAFQRNAIMQQSSKYKIISQQQVLHKILSDQYKLKMWGMGDKK